jgi:lipopolysaccharide export system permease protein
MVDWALHEPPTRSVAVILQKYILRGLLVTFLLTYSVVMAVFLVGTLLQLFRSFSRLGLDTVLQIIPLAACGGAVWACIIAVCPTVTLVYGRLSADHEIDAMKLCGVATIRIIWPAVLLGVLLAGGTYYVLEVAAPAANYARRMLLRDFSINLLKAPPPGKQQFPFGRFELSYLDCVDGVFQLPYITEFTNGSPDVIYTALTGHAVTTQSDAVQLILTKPTMIRREPGKKESIITSGSDVTINLPLEDFSSSDKRPDQEPIEVIKELIRKAPPGGKRTWMLIILYSRYAEALAPFLLVMISAPLGILVRHGSRMAGLGVALPPVLLYLIVHHFFHAVGEGRNIPPIVAAFAPDILLGILSVALLWKVCRR